MGFRVKLGYGERIVVVMAFLGDVQSIDAARAWNNEYSLEGRISAKDLVLLRIFLAFFAEITDQERTHHSNPLLNQVEISAADRQTLVSWLINVCRSPAQLQVQSMHQVIRSTSL